MRIFCKSLLWWCLEKMTVLPEVLIYARTSSSAWSGILFVNLFTKAHLSFSIILTLMSPLFLKQSVIPGCYSTWFEGKILCYNFNTHHTIYFQWELFPSLCAIMCSESDNFRLLKSMIWGGQSIMCIPFTLKCGALNFFQYPENTMCNSSYRCTKDLNTPRQKCDMAAVPYEGSPGISSKWLWLLTDMHVFAVFTE